MSRIVHVGYRGTDNKKQVLTLFIKRIENFEDEPKKKSLLPLSLPSLPSALSPLSDKSMAGKQTQIAVAVGQRTACAETVVSCSELDLFLH